MPESSRAHFVEILSVARARTDLDAPVNRPVVVLTIRPEPGSWRPQNLGLTIAQAERLRDDLTSLLEAPATFILLAVLALATGCSARVEVVNERPAAVEADSASVPPAASEKQSVVVDVDFRGQQQPGPVASPVASEQRAITPNPTSLNLGGIQVSGSENQIEFHYHRYRRSRLPVIVHPIIRHEIVIVPNDGSAPVVFMDNAPPRVVLTDKQAARAYAAHMLRLAQREGLR